MCEDEDCSRVLTRRSSCWSVKRQLARTVGAYSQQMQTFRLLQNHHFAVQNGDRREVTQLGLYLGIFKHRLGNACSVQSKALTRTQRNACRLRRWNALVSTILFWHTLMTTLPGKLRARAGELSTPVHTRTVNRSLASCAKNSSDSHYKSLLTSTSTTGMCCIRWLRK